MTEDLTNISRLDSPLTVLQNLKYGAVVYAPRSQRDSIKTAKQRVKDRTPFKKFSILTINDYVIQIKRTK